ncbi:hypothetical protein J4E85_006813 [Alternaria conjuncta]|uniref:uncharacterized protein n=1 Tax=Alternaria conjuncta TaxID=181017 RepID=UPI00221EA5DD|nr:uncharacterized protein J4E85_006813 [Alternaria conjuncta]KAI4926519.1 hypothetical protein J4E85_006813 [Alternaria conjuncta]
MSTTAKPRNKSDFLMLGDETYVLQKIDRGARPSKIRDRASKLFRFDDPLFKRMKQYVYDPLPPKMIRLMRLYPGDREDSIQCELFEAAYDNSFHIPTHVRRQYENPKVPESQHQDQTEAKRTLQEVKDSLRALINRMKNTQEIAQVVDGATEETGMEVMEKEKERLILNFEVLKRKILEEELEAVGKIEIEYEALSWCWGRDDSDCAVSVTKGGEAYKMPVRRDLALALKYLRHQEKPRILWIDAICINQDNHVERNQQVQMMSRVYTRAANVCIWLGQQDDESEVAFKFIKEEITHLKDFDSISSDKDYNSKWHALMVLMQREWFSRRWVVQELSLANKAEIWCGPDSMPWKEFAVAVELFVEVESATHRLSEVMQTDVQFRHVSGWFEGVSQLGASVLVQATGKVFRSYGTPMDRNEVDDKDTDQKLTDEEKTAKEEKARKKATKEKHDQRVKSLDSIQTIDPLDRRSLLSLEYLVTTMFIFKASECRDSVYSMLAIARDAAPFASNTMPDTTNETTVDDNAVPVTKPFVTANDADLPFLLSLFQGFLAEKPFLVDYTRPYSDVCRDFMEFCIERKSAHDPVQALDILCRPWALEPQPGDSARVKKRKRSPAVETGRGSELTYVRSEEELDLDVYWRKKIEGETSEAVWRNEAREKLCEISQKRKEREKKARMEEIKRMKDSQEEKENRNDDINMEQSKDVDLPSWVPRAKNAPFEIYRHPGIQIKKTGRANADPLVGWPQDGHRNYSAAQTETVKLDYLRFKKRPRMGHYSLYVTGFKVDEIDEVRDASQGGSIPNSWLELSGWEPPYTQDPPPEFWRTIVADRGFDNRNPPYYYARACRESVDKGGRESGSVNTTALINNERNSIIAEFCRRVHAVIWGRSLFKTKAGKLGLGKNVQKGDVVCVLHGCTVPVILSAHTKKEGDQAKESFEDSYQAIRSCMQRLDNIQVCKRRYEKQKEKFREQEGQTPAVSSWEQEVKDAREKVNSILARDKEQRGKKDIMKQRFKKDEEIFYIFKGESYVHGCMDGEAVRERFYGTEQEWIYELR